MFEQKEFVKRLLLIIEALNKTQKEFCNEVGMQPSHLSFIKNKGMVPGLEITTKICETYGINLNWLALGRGEMFIEQENLLNRVKDAGVVYNKSSTTDEFLDIVREISKYDLEHRKAFIQLFKAGLELTKK